MALPLTLILALAPTLTLAVTLALTLALPLTLALTWPRCGCSGFSPKVAAMRRSCASLHPSLGPWEISGRYRRDMGEI